MFTNHYFTDSIHKNGPKIKLFGSPWSPPAWMKVNDSAIDKGAPLKGEVGGEYYQTWANYFVK